MTLFAALHESAFGPKRTSAITNIFSGLFPLASYLVRFCPMPIR
jgi:hypothetical protein